MKDLVWAIIFSLLFSFAAFQTTSDESGLHEGYERGTGHIDFPGMGKSLGHDKHDCDPTCPYCGGDPCIPPCDGTGGGGGGF